MIRLLRRLDGYELFAQGLVVLTDGRQAQLLTNRKQGTRINICLPYPKSADTILGETAMLFRPRTGTQNHYMLLTRDTLEQVYYT